MFFTDKRKPLNANFCFSMGILGETCNVQYSKETMCGVDNLKFNVLDSNNVPITNKLNIKALTTIAKACERNYSAKHSLLANFD